MSWFRRMANKAMETINKVKVAEGDAHKVKARTVSSGGHTKYTIADNLDDKDKILLGGHEKILVRHAIENLILQNSMMQVKSDVQEACEIVANAMEKDMPVRASLVQKIVPDLKLDYERMRMNMGEMQYNRGRNRIYRENIDVKREIIIEDTNKTRSGPFRTMSEESNNGDTGNNKETNFVTDYQNYTGPRRR